MLLGKLAVGVHCQGRGLGAELLTDVHRRTLLISDHVGICLLVVDALHEQAASFYRKHDFRELPDSPLHLFKTLDDIAQLGLLERNER